VIEPLVVVLKGEPQGKGRPRSRIATGRGGAAFIAVYTPKATRDYENALALAGRITMGSRPPLKEPLVVSVIALMPVPSSWSRRKRDAALAGTVRPTGAPDWDNLAKVLDALNGIVWRDDAQIVSGSVEKWYGEEPEIKVEIRPLAVFEEHARSDLP
jgi:Holliday junction resolvase RusA-like endonuclease